LSESQLARFSPGALAWYASQKKWQTAPHLNLLNRKLVDVAAGRCKRLILTMPPRHGKSMLTSQYFPAWFLGNFPDRRVILASYEADFAAGWGRKARDVLEEHGEAVFGVRVRGDSSAAHRWDLAGHTGGMQTAGVGGPLTGKGADLLVIDDPVKNAEEATSKAHKDKSWDWFRSTAYTRLEPGGAVILIMTRWAVDDLAGRLLDQARQGGERWEVFNLPALAEEDDPLGRGPGEALWPQRFDVAQLERIRQTLGSFWFGAMYQQRPTLPEGNHFKRSWFDRRFVDFMGEIRLDTGERFQRWQIWKFIVVDPAASEKQTADYTAIGVFALAPGNRLLVLEMIRERLPLEQIVPRLRRLCGYYRPEFVSFEANGFQVALANEARRTDGMPAVREIEPEGRGKLVRATKAIIRAEAGQVLLPVQAPWVEGFLEELVQFTGLDDPHDDQTDVLSYACIELDRTGPFEPPPVIDTPRRHLEPGRQEGPEARRKPGVTVTSFDVYPAVILDEPERGRRRSFFHDF
jgi:predicted phage terminase large subunit-like protein